MATRRVKYISRYAFVDGELDEQTMGDDPASVSLRFEERSEEEEYEPEEEEDEDYAPEEDEDRRVPLDWVNNISAHIDEGEDEVAVRISLGDPRGGFVMSVRRLPDGTLMLYTPYEGMMFSHMPLTKVHEGSYRIGNYGE